MPYYTWQCKNCDNEFEVIRKMDDYNVAPQVPCEGCENMEWTKLLTSSPIHGSNKGNYNSGS